ncbi:MAG: beta-lactamase family protein [Clostridiales Family XIII bacterium]|jgi:CubicO group peptidase (beta-lactamase class C family)|nr:beta-lactamase family protein [Clostridiales Family XIII bacterium]
MLTEDGLSRAIDGYLADNKEDIAAISVAVFTKREILYENTYGYIDIAKGLENEKDAVLEWGSVTKLLVWVSVMQLVERGQIDLDKDIRDYLPDGFLRKLKYDEKITLVHLMNHTAGFQEASAYFNEETDSADLLSLEECLRLSEPMQIFRPGETSAYSNWGAALAGYIVERVSGKPFYEYVHENIFAVLGMEHTALNADLSDNTWVQKQRQNVHCYGPELEDMGLCISFIPAYPCGSATGTIGDLTLFAQALLPDDAGGSPLFDSPQTLTALYTPTLYYPDGNTVNNRHGFWERIAYVDVFGHDGGTTGMSATLMINPTEGIGYVAFTNSFADLGSLAPMVFKSRTFPEGTTLTPEEYERFAGVYADTRGIWAGFLKADKFLGGNIIKISSDGKTVSTDSTMWQGATIKKIEENIYLVVNEEAEFSEIVFATFDETGTAKTIYFAGESIRVDKTTYAVESILFALFIGSLILSALMLIAWVVGLLRKKRFPFSKARLSVYLTTVLTLLPTVYLQSGAWVGTSYSGLVCLCLIYLLAAIVALLYIVFLFIKWSKTETTKWERAYLITTGITGLIVAFNIFYWQIWMFWLY